MIDANTVDPMPEEDDCDWFEGDPVPLSQAVQLPPFPVAAMPEPIAEMVCAVSEATQTDPAMAATSALSALSACSGGHAEIEIRHGWREPLCLYTATIAAPGERKSAVQLTLTRPILDVEAHLADKGKAARLEAETRKQVAIKAAEQQRATAAKAQAGDRDKKMADAIGAAMIAASIRGAADRAAGCRRHHARSRGIFAGRAGGSAGDHLS